MPTSSTIPAKLSYSLTFIYSSLLRGRYALVSVHFFIALRPCSPLSICISISIIEIKTKTKTNIQRPNANVSLTNPHKFSVSIEYSSTDSRAPTPRSQLLRQHFLKPHLLEHQLLKALDWSTGSLEPQPCHTHFAPSSPSQKFFLTIASRTLAAFSQLVFSGYIQLIRLPFLPSLSPLAMSLL